jgi:PhzF family phenazine biosynthesis protein
MEEELDFAGHPVLGAAAALHEETMAGIRKVTWTFQLNKKSFPVQTIRQDSHYRAEMDQGVCNFGAVLSPQESVAFLDALNLGRDHLLDKFPLQIASTGLPYLLVPVDRDLDAARIVKPEFEKQLARFGAKFVYVFDLNRKEGRTWDNDGRVEDIATGICERDNTGDWDYLIPAGRDRKRLCCFCLQWDGHTLVKLADVNSLLVFVVSCMRDGVFCMS